jgi:epoxyqueuosine reductase
MSLTGSVKAEAQRLGFQLAGVTTPAPPSHLNVFEAWLRAGRHGEMDYLAKEPARQRRGDPRQILPECRSILVLGMRYPAEERFYEDSPEQKHPAERTGRIAAYARQVDYHLVLPEKLKALVAFIENQVGHPVPNRWYTDTGPVLERDLAQRAGLGWIGKNTCLIHPDQGSYLLLAEILLGIELDPDPPFLPDRCGSCTRCLDACPTQCILPDRTIDARRCISYLTIELRGPIPTDLRTFMGDWVFGCDVCQEVCPWNQHADFVEGRPSQESRSVEPIQDLGWFEDSAPGVGEEVRSRRVELVAGLALTPQEFNRQFKRSPLKRAKRRGYLRNVAVALGNQAAGTGDAESVQALSGALQDHEPLVRGHAAWALGQVGGEAARQALSEASGRETDLYVMGEIRVALDHCAGLTSKQPQAERFGKPG